MNDRGFGRAARFQFISSASRSFLLFLHQWLMARLYGPAVFGICNTAVAGWQTATMLGRAAGDTVVLRDDEHGGSSNSPIVARATTLSVIGGIGAGIILAAWGIVASHRIQPIPTVLAFLLAGLAVPLATSVYPLAATLQRQHRFRAYSLVATLADPVARVCALAIAALAGAHWLAAMSSILVGAAGAVGIAIMLLYPHLRGQRATLGRAAERWGMLRFSWLTTLATAAQNAMLFAALSISGFLANAAGTGALAVAARVAMLALWIQIACATPFLPRIPALAADPSRHFELQTTYHRVIASVLWANAPFLVGLSVASRAIMRVFGTGYDAGADLLVLLAVAQWVNSATAVAEDFLPLTGRSALAAVNNAAALTATVLLGVLLGRRFGVTGIALAYSASIIGLNVVRAVQIRSVLGVHLPGGTIARMGGASAVVFIVARVALHGIRLTMPAGLASGAAAAALVVLLMLLMSTTRDRDVLRMLLRGTDV